MFNDRKHFDTMMSEIAEVKQERYPYFGLYIPNQTPRTSIIVLTPSEPTNPIMRLLKAIRQMPTKLFNIVRGL